MYMTSAPHLTESLDLSIASAYAIDWSQFLQRPLSTLSPDCDRVVEGETVLITGAGGSIGSGLACQLMRSAAETLVLLDNSEHSLRDLYRRFKEWPAAAPNIEFVHEDVRSRSGLRKIFFQYRPNVVFHAAALKHVV